MADAGIGVERTDFVGIPTQDLERAERVSLRVPDVAAAMERLRAGGVEFDHEEVYDSGVCHMAFFKDPDGNSLILHHRYAP